MAAKACEAGIGYGPPVGILGSALERLSPDRSFFPDLRLMSAETKSPSLSLFDDIDIHLF